MDNKMIKFISLILLFIIVVGIPHLNFAIETDITSKTFINDMNPNKNQSKTVTAITTPITKSIVEITNKVLGIIQVLGALLTVVSISMYGFNVILSANGSLANDLGFGGKEKDNPNTSKHWLDFGRHLLIGSVLLFSSVTLVRFVFNIFFT